MCIDYRKLNDNTIKERYYFPETQDIFDKLGGCNYFSTIDLVKGYYQIPMSEDSKSLTAFSTPFGHFQF